MVVQVVAAPVEDGKARLLGQAKVTQVLPRRVVVRPDEEVLAAKDVEWLVVLPAAPAAISRPQPSDSGPARSSPEASTPAPEAPPPVAPAPEPVKPSAPRELQGRIAVKNTDIFNKALSLTNTDDIVWIGCAVVIRGRDFARVGGLAPGKTREIPLKNFAKGWRGRYVDLNRVGLFCEEGEREFPLKL
jgi:eukaryotic-like serine/threonine-protein kinase